MQLFLQIANSANLAAGELFLEAFDFGVLESALGGFVLVAAAAGALGAVAVDSFGTNETRIGRPILFSPPRP